MSPFWVHIGTTLRSAGTSATTLSNPPASPGRRQRATAWSGVSDTGCRRQIQTGAVTPIFQPMAPGSERTARTATVAAGRRRRTVSSSFRLVRQLLSAACQINAPTLTTGSFRHPAPRLRARRWCCSMPAARKPAELCAGLEGRLAQPAPTRRRRQRRLLSRRPARHQGPERPTLVGGNAIT